MKRFMLGICIAFLMAPLSSRAAEREQYVAIGDSLAAGQTPYQEIDYGYADMIALQLSRNNQLLSFNKSLAFPGYTVAKVRESIESEDAKELLNSATLVTVSAGANDLLPLLSHSATRGTITFSQLAVNFSLNKVRGELAQLLQELKQLAPNAKVVVMGYYFPYISIHDEQRVGAVKQLALLNEILKQQAQQNDALFIDVERTFTVSRFVFLPNINDVHPNALGYMAMANEFLKAFNVPILTEQQLPEPQPQSFNELLQQSGKYKNNDIGYIFYEDKSRSIYKYHYVRALL